MASISCCMLIIPRNKANSLTSINTKTVLKPRFISCKVASINLNCDQTVTRRSANYRPPIWDFDFIQSLNSKYSGERYLMRASELKVQVETMLEGAMDTVYQLELIDEMQRMGISYHFEEEIKKMLTGIYQKKYGKNEEIKETDLYSTTLEFRLLRQHGFSISQDIFDCYKNEDGEFKPSLRDDTKGLLQLYEASHMLVEGEKTMELAREFATILLKENIEVGLGHTIDQNMTLLVGHALELPLHWRVERPNARWFIEAYERREDMNRILLEFAKLDFNILQATYEQELKQVSRWWKSTYLAENLPFARDRLVEGYIWSLGLFTPCHEDSRILITKVIALITIIDDVFDVHGTLEELELFNNIIQRWDTEALDKLPHYMQICFLALDNFINEMSYDVFKKQGIVIIPHLRKLWKDQSKTYTQEANWYSMGYTPTMEEYIINAWKSVGCKAVLCHVFFLLTNPIDKETFQCLYNDHDLLRYSGMIARLANDLGTSPEEMKRGDVPKLIQCYMNETGASRDEALEYVKLLMQETWKHMNKELVAKSPFSQTFVRLAADAGRAAQYMYHNADGHGNQNLQIKELMSKLLFEPIE